MRHSIVTGTLLPAAVLLSACVGSPKKSTDHHAFGYTGTTASADNGTQFINQTVPETSGTGTSAPTGDVKPKTESHMTPIAPPPDGGKPTPLSVPPTRKDIQYGIPVPNKPGLVTSPYAPGAGFIDVRGLAPGTEVVDPYSNKHILVP